MIIRNSIKGIIIKNTKLLVTEMKHEQGIYYTLPGGKQEPNELMLDALQREVLEETGYIVEQEVDTHRIEFMFVCNIVEEVGESALMYDFNQIGTHWLNIDNIMHEPLFPVDMRKVIKNYFLGKKSPIYLGEMK